MERGRWAELGRNWKKERNTEEGAVIRVVIGVERKRNKGGIEKEQKRIGKK